MTRADFTQFRSDIAHLLKEARLCMNPLQRTFFNQWLRDHATLMIDLEGLGVADQHPAVEETDRLAERN